MSAVTVQGREPRGATQRLLIVYRCAECGTAGVQSEMVQHLRDRHGVRVLDTPAMFSRAVRDYRNAGRAQQGQAQEG